MERSQAQFRRVARRSGPPITLSFDGKSIHATGGDSVLAALLENGAHARRLEFGAEPRAGFCLMGACQDCWIATAEGARLRACSTFIAPGMALLSGGGPR